MGDSFAMQFDGLIVMREGLPALGFRSYSVRHPHLANIDSPIAPATPMLIEEALVAAQLLIRHDATPTVTHAAGAPWMHFAGLSEHMTPYLLLSFGIADIRTLLPTFPAEDFELPPAAAERWPSPCNEEPLRSGALSWPQARHWMWRYVKPLQHAIVRLRRTGFAHIGMLAAAPLHPVDTSFAAVMRTLKVSLPQVRLRAAFRYKMIAMVNELIAWICDREGVRFIDTWPLLARDGFLRTEIDWGDRVHVSHAAFAELANGVVADAVYDAFAPARQCDDPALSYVPGDWVVRQTATDAALVCAGGEALEVHRPELGMIDVWKAREVRAATPDEIARARSR